MRPTRLVHVAEVRPGQGTSPPLAAESDPPAVAGPTVPRFRIRAVDLELAVVPRGQVHEVQIAAGLIDGKAAVAAHAEQKKSPVR